MNGDRMTWVVIGLILVAFGLVAVSRLAPNARLRRRLRKTHSRIVSKARQPSVQLNVKPPKE
jgi:hypothetical protein